MRRRRPVRVVISGSTRSCRPGGRTPRRPSSDGARAGRLARPARCTSRRRLGDGTRRTPARERSMPTSRSSSPPSLAPQALSPRTASSACAAHAAASSAGSRRRARGSGAPSSAVEAACLVRRNAFSAPGGPQGGDRAGLGPQLVVAHRQQPGGHVDALQRPAEGHEQVALVARHGPLDDAVDDEQPLDHPVQGDAGAGREHHAAGQRHVGGVEGLEHVAGQLVADAAGVLAGRRDRRRRSVEESLACR